MFFTFSYSGGKIENEIMTQKLFDLLILTLIISRIHDWIIKK